MLHLLSYVAPLLLLCSFLTGTQAAVVRENLEKPESGEELVVPVDVALRLVLYTLDPIGGGNLVTALKEAISGEEGRDLGKTVNQILRIMAEFEARYPSVVDKIKEALESIFLVGPIQFGTTLAPAALEAREETTPDPFADFVLPAVDLIHGLMQVFHEELGGLPGVIDLFTEFVPAGPEVAGFLIQYVRELIKYT